MAGLQVLEETFASQGFHVLGFLENNFGNQAGNPDQVDMCTAKYHVTFPQFDLADVVGPNQQPVWQWLLSQPNAPPMSDINPTWNFNKYLVSRDGHLVNHWDSPVYPGDDPNSNTDSFDTNEIVIAIRAELAKSP